MAQVCHICFFHDPFAPIPPRWTLLGHSERRSKYGETDEEQQHPVHLQGVRCVFVFFGAQGLQRSEDRRWV